MEPHQRDEQVRRRVYAYIKGNANASRDEIQATLEADPVGPISPPEVTKAIQDLEAEGLIFQLSTSVIGGDRYAAVD